MSALDNILVVVDPQAQHQAGLAKGALLAQKSQARLDLFACGGSAHAAFQLQALARSLRDCRLRVTTQSARNGTFSVALSQRLKHTGAKFVIKDIRQHAVTKRPSLTDIDWELIRSCPATLLLSKPTLWPERPQICAAVDPAYRHDTSWSSEQIVLEEAAALARQMGGDLHVVHAYIPPALVATLPAEDDSRALEYSHELVIGECHAQLRNLKTLASDYGVPPSRVHVTIGPVCDALKSLLSELKASVVVMTAVSRSSLRRDVIGSTAERLLEQISCDVLVARSQEAASLHH